MLVGPSANDQKQLAYTSKVNSTISKGKLYAVRARRSGTHTLRKTRAGDFCRILLPRTPSVCSERGVERPTVCLDGLTTDHAYFDTPTIKELPLLSKTWSPSGLSQWNGDTSVSGVSHEYMYEVLFTVQRFVWKLTLDRELQSGQVSRMSQ